MKPEMVLIVDDDPVGLLTLEMALGSEYRVRVAGTGEAALEIAHSAERPGLVLLDVGMPGLDGFEVCRKLKADTATRDIPVVFVTGYGALEDEARGFEVGGVDYLTKPISPPIVRARVTTHLALAHQNQVLEQKVRERTLALAMAEEHWRTLLEVAPDAMILVDRAGRIQTINGQTTNFFGYGKEELIGQPIGLLVPDRSSAAHAQKVAHYSQAPATRPMAQGQDLMGRRKDGTEFPIDVGLGAMTTPNGTMTLAAIRDITARKAAEREREKMQIQLRHAQHMEAIGEMAAGIAHEINTPTQYISDNTVFMRDSLKDLLECMDAERTFLGSCAGSPGAVPPEAWAAQFKRFELLDLDYLGQELPKAIQQTLDGVARISKIVGAMKDFSHPGTESKVPTDLNRAIETTLTISRSAWKYVAELETDLQADLPLVPCYPGEFSQAILNLVVNAAHAIEAKAEGQPSKGLGSIRVSTRLVGGQVEVRVEDTGTGIPEALRGRIFEPFFTTKPIGKGTGQGLAIAHAIIVNKLNGTIEVESAMGKGTTFILRFPLATVGAIA